MNITIKDKDKLIDFLNNIALVRDVCVLTIEKDKMWCLVQSACTTFLMYSETDAIGCSTNVELNIPDIRRLVWSLERIDTDVCNELEIMSKPNSNTGAYINYKSKIMRFRYYLLGDKRVAKPKANPENIKKFEGDCKFTVNPANLVEIVKARSFTTATKAYFYSKESSIHCCLDDRRESSMDSVTLMLSEHYDGPDIISEDSKPMNMEAIQALVGTKPELVESTLDSSKGIMTFNIKTKHNKAKYILTPMIK
tara:strand:+ start:44680 stop:45435 length:756 start_codon:yes stop_codon:yes gene_type:complete